MSMEKKKMEDLENESVYHKYEEMMNDLGLRLIEQAARGSVVVGREMRFVGGDVVPVLGNKQDHKLDECSPQTEEGE